MRVGTSFHAYIHLLVQTSFKLIDIHFYIEIYMLLIFSPYGASLHSIAVDIFPTPKLCWRQHFSFKWFGIIPDGWLIYIYCGWWKARILQKISFDSIEKLCATNYGLWTCCIHRKTSDYSNGGSHRFGGLLLGCLPCLLCVAHPPLKRLLAQQGVYEVRERFLFRIQTHIITIRADPQQLSLMYFLIIWACLAGY